MLQPLSVTLLAKDSAATIEEVLASVSWADEVIVLDTGSKDATCEIASRFPNVTLHRSPFIGFGELHNLATSYARNDWILSVDSDEIVSPELQKNLQTLALDSSCVYSLPRHNYFNGKWIRGCGWYPDRVVRLYHRGQTRFSSHQVHERVLTEGLTVIPLATPLLHFSYRSIADFLAKMQHYSELFAKEQAGKKTSSLAKALAHGGYTFFKSYLLKRGFRDGYEGAVISIYNAQVAFYKYLKLAELNKTKAPASQEETGDFFEERSSAT